MDGFMESVSLFATLKIYGLLIRTFKTFLSFLKAEIENAFNMDTDYECLLTNIQDEY